MLESSRMASMLERLKMRLKMTGWKDNLLCTISLQSGESEEFRCWDVRQFMLERLKVQSEMTEMTG